MIAKNVDSFFSSQQTVDSGFQVVWMPRVSKMILRWHDHAHAHLASSSHPSPFNSIQNQMINSLGCSIRVQTSLRQSDSICRYLHCPKWEIWNLWTTTPPEVQPLLPLAELQEERRRAPQTSLATTKGRCARTTRYWPSPSCLSSSCAVVHIRT